MFVVLKKLIEKVEFSVVEPSLRALVGHFLDAVSVADGQRGIRGNTSREMSVEMSNSLNGGCPG